VKHGASLVAFLALATLVGSGCARNAPSEDRIVGAIARSDSLRRGMKHRHPQSWEGYPVAASADSDSVAWLNASPGTMTEVH